MAKKSVFHQLLRAIALAMVVAVVVLSIINNSVSTKDLVLLLGIGLFCQALSSFS